MNRSSNRSNSTERPCGLTALLPLGECRGKVEAFARNLQTRLHSLGSFVRICYSSYLFIFSILTNLLKYYYEILFLCCF